MMTISKSKETKMSDLAQIVLHPNRFTISGPPILVLTIETIARDHSLTPEQARDRIDEVFADWHVICSVSGKLIRLHRLKYWDVDKQAVYASPEMVPTPDCYKLS